MQNEIAQFTVVGHEQGAFRIEIESTDGKKTLGKVGHKIGNRRPTLRVGEGGHVPGRFVEQDIDFLLELDRLAVTGDDILSRVDFQTHRLHDVAVDGNPTGADQFLGTSAGSDTGLGEDFLQSFTHSVRRADGIPSTVVSERGTGFSGSVPAGGRRFFRPPACWWSDRPPGPQGTRVSSGNRRRWAARGRHENGGAFGCDRGCRRLVRSG